MLTRFLALCASYLFLCFPAFGTHNLAGYISLKKVSATDRTYEVNIYTLTDPSSWVDRCAMNLYAFDEITGLPISVIEDIPRINGPAMQGIPNTQCSIANARNGIPLTSQSPEKWNHYQVEYTFPFDGAYSLIVFDPALLGDIVNITHPLRENMVFYTNLVIWQNAPLGDVTPVFLNRSLERATIGRTWTHLPGGYDGNADSLRYELVETPGFDQDNPSIPPLPVNGYTFPDDPIWGNSSLSIGPRSGLITWNSPQTEGLYSVCYLVKAWENGILRSETLSTITVYVEPALIPTDLKLRPLADSCVGNRLYKSFALVNRASEDDIFLTLNNFGSHDNVPFAPSVDTLANFYGEIWNTVAGTSQLFDSTDLPLELINTPNIQTDSLVFHLEWRRSPQDLSIPNPRLELCAYRETSFGTSSSDVNFYWSLPLDCSTSTSVRDQPEPTIAVFPNPTTDQLRIETSLSGPLTYEWIDLTGRSLQRGKLSSQERELILPNLKPGIYLFRLREASGKDYIQRIRVE